ncbi:MAG: FapA family protein [candidate division Zixibacteria bacterium]|nr:FapA family protein [candidate division Zixibacteria bacterium]
MSPSSENSTESVQSTAVRIKVAKDSMSAMMVIGKPPPESREPAMDDVKDAIERAGVIYGIDWDVVQKALDDKEWDTPVCIADGTKPVKGVNTVFEYTFETERNNAPEEDEDGHIDYRSLNFIQNVNEGDVLARKTPPTKGVDGTSVKGSPVKAPNGKEIPFLSGKGTKISEDELSLIAAASGSVVMTRNSLSVDEVTNIKGDVDMSVGNIDSVGSVSIKGDVKAGFQLKVGGNLDINGNVEDCNIDCGGNIIIKGGCFGKGDGNIKAKGDIVIKYAEGQVIVSGGNVTVGGELLNCNVTAFERVDVCGKKGTIVGGAVYAGKEIRVPFVGSDAGTVTNLYVGYDAELADEYNEINNQIERINVDSERVKKTLYQLYRLQTDGQLDSGKKKVLEKLEAFRSGVPEELKSLEAGKVELEERMGELKDAKIVVENTIYNGAFVHFGIVYRDFPDSVKSCKATLEGNQVMLSALEDDDTDN